MIGDHGQGGLRLSGLLVVLDRPINGEGDLGLIDGLLSLVPC